MFAIQPIAIFVLNGQIRIETQNFDSAGDCLTVRDVVAAVPDPTRITVYCANPGREI